jgi:hypothetical protein
MSTSTLPRSDPRTRYTHASPPAQTQSSTPGSEQKMRPKADHGEHSYEGSNRLQDCVALITGGDSGIGRAVAIAFAREGADVAISYLEEHEDAHDTAHWIGKSGRKFALLPGDITNESHCTGLVQHTVNEFGKIDILINNAAFQMPHENLNEWSSEQFEHTFRTNLFSMFYLSKAAHNHMKPGSVIINTASIQAYQPGEELLDYATSKSAVLGFTKALAKLAMKNGIRVNAVAPGPVWTPLIPSTFDAQKVAEFGQNTVLGRPAQPAELAPIYVFLASPEASYITGEVYGATGGRTPV